MPWIKTGTVSIAQNSTTVTGAGTQFVEDGRVGDAFIGPDGGIYEVTNIASSTVLAIAPPYKGTSASGGTYALVPVQGYNKDTADALRQASLEVGGALDGLDESVQQAADYASSAQASKNAAAASETNAGQSSAAALASKNAAGVSETNAAQSAAAALASKNAAGVSETNAGQSAAAAQASKNAAAVSEANAATSASAAASLGVGKSYIDGLRLVYVGRNALTVEAGAAYISATGKVVTLTAAKALTGLTFTASAFHHVYLYDNAGVGDIEISATVPVRVAGTVFQKTGDASRRYLGSVLANASAQMFSFRHEIAQSRIRYTEGTPGLAPFVLMSGGSASTFTAIFTGNAVPVQTALVAMIVASLAGSTASVSFDTIDQISSGSGSNWMAAIGTGVIQVPLEVPVSKSSSNPAQFRYAMQSGSCSIYLQGYYFER